MKVTTYGPNSEIDAKYEYDNGVVSFNLSLCGMTVVVTFGDFNTTIGITQGNILTQFVMDARPCRWEENAIVFARSVMWAYVNVKSKKKSKSLMADKVVVFDHTTLVTEITSYNIKTKKVKVNYVR